MDDLMGENWNPRCWNHYRLPATDYCYDCGSPLCSACMERVCCGGRLARSGMAAEDDPDVLARYEEEDGADPREEALTDAERNPGLA